jgi:hypothetical protein
MKASFRSRQVDTVAEVVFGATGHVERLAQREPARPDRGDGDSLGSPYEDVRGC